MGAGLSKTLKDKDMDRIFMEVQHSENLVYPAQNNCAYFT